MICSHRVRTPSSVGLDDWSPGAQPGLDHGDFRVLPGSWADPLVYMPWAGTPGDPRRQAKYGAEDVAFRSSHDVGSPIRSLEADYHGLHTRCLRFSAIGLPQGLQDSLPVGGQPLPGRIRTYWAHDEGFQAFTSSFPPSQSSPGARGVSAAAMRVR